MMRIIPKLFVALLVCAPQLSLAETDAERERFFESRIRPILTKHCLDCHGAEKQQAGLRLDSLSAAKRGNDAGAAIVPGKPDEGRLMAVVRYSDYDYQMPPAGKLPDKEIKLLEEWIRSGAYWPESSKTDEPEGLPDPFPRKEDGGIDFAKAAASHWAYQPVGKPKIPEVRANNLPQTAVDAFVLNRLEQENLTFSPRADRRTLIRRLYFDLLGLPPTYDEIEEFLQDEQPGAYERLVDRLLASPQYGERWGRHWLDIARYADTKGYVFTQNPRYPYAYTYRDYVVDALNRDLPYDEFIRQQLAADKLLPADSMDTDLAAVGFLTVGRRFLNNTHDVIDDRIDVVMRGVMASTVTCARCHDHKYDPIPTSDYYSLYGIFASTTEPGAGDLPLIGEVNEDDPGYQQFMAELQKREQAVHDYLVKTQQELHQQGRDRIVDSLKHLVARKKLVPDGVEVTYQHGRPSDKQTRAWELHLDRRVKPNDPVWGLWKALVGLPQAEFSQKVKGVIEERLKNLKSLNPLVKAAFTQAEVSSMLDVAQIYGDLLLRVHQKWQQTPDRGDSLSDIHEEQLRQQLYGENSPTAVPLEQISLLFERDKRDQHRKLLKKIEEWQVQSEHAPPRAMVLADKAQPATAHVFLRGNPGRRGDKVPRRVPRVFTPEQPTSFDDSGRLGLANFLADDQNPLTSRVIANRLWQHHFGRGLVATPSDFGTRGIPPTHPELLDYLASYLVEQDWSLKQLHRLILLSTAYQQSSIIEQPSELHQKAIAADPENRLLWRMNRRRAGFEVTRDSILASCGMLDPAMRGRPTSLERQPYTVRRTIYGIVDRNNLPTLFRTFDFPSPDASSGERPQTTVPQQALFHMNSPFMQFVARSVQQDLPQGVKLEAKVRELYRRILSRDPSGDEVSASAEFVKLAANQAEGLRLLAQVLLMTNEFAFVD